MGETQNRQQSSRLGLIRGRGSSGGGEIIEVQGGHIVRSTGRKDRHSKVCTAKGPRDRRVRLSAHTAIQFYDVQDRLGYDRPSKAVDWLIKKAKAAIDELAELPPWRPTATVNPPKSSEKDLEEENQRRGENEGFVGSASKRQMAVEQIGSGYVFHQNQQEQHQHQQQQQQSNNPRHSSNSFLPPSLDSDAIADTIKSFFPVATSPSSINFQNYPSPPDLLSRTSSQSQDLRLSLHPFQDSMLLQHHQHHHSNPTSSPEPPLFSSAFDAGTTSWSEEPMQEMGRFQRMIAWNPITDSSGGGGSGGFMFNSPPQPPQQAVQTLLTPNPFFSQRGPLQSSNSPSVRTWNNDPSMVGVNTDHYQNLTSSHNHQQQSISGTGFASGGFGFRIPARIQGEEDHDVGVSHKPPSSASRH